MPPDQWRHYDPYLHSSHNRDKRQRAPACLRELPSAVAGVQVVIDADTRLVAATGRPVPGDVNDSQALRRSGMAAICDGESVLADGAY